jgi:copper(I)-binding protein
LAALPLFAMQTVALSSAVGHEFKAGEITLQHPFSRVTPKGAKTGAAYMTIVNSGTSPDRLIRATTEISERTEIHRTTTTEDGVTRMRAQPDGIIIPAARDIKLQPAGEYHIMLVNLREPLQEGMKIPFTLDFEKAGSVTVQLAVEGLRKRPETQPNHSDHGN